MSESGSVVRPGGVTFVAVLVIINAALDLIAGVYLLFNTSSLELRAEYGGDGAVVTAGILYIVFGLVLLLIARGLLRGNTVARAIVTVVQGLALVASVFLMFALPAFFLGAVISAGIALLVILLLWTGRASAFFRE